MKKDFLEPKAVIELKVRHKKSKERKEADLIKAILMLNSGYSVAFVCQVLLIDDETLRRQVNDYLEKGKFLPQKPAGRSELLSQEQADTLFKAMREEIFHDSKQVCAFVKEKFNIDYSVSGMGQFLKRHHFSYRYTVNVPAKADAQKQKEFVEKYQQLKANIDQDKETILFMDGVHPSGQAKLCKGWFYKGEKFQVKNGVSRRLNILGAMEYDSKNVSYQHYKTINEESALDFLGQLRSEYGDKTIHLILDNGAYNTSKSVQEFASKNNIYLHFLPTYSPNLNLIERLWKMLKQGVSYGKYHKTFKDFKNAVFDFLDNVNHRISHLDMKLRFSDVFHIENTHSF